jgi:hypothetical protein
MKYFCRKECKENRLLIKHNNRTMNFVVLWLRRLVAGLAPRRPGFKPGSVHVGFMVDKVALGQVSLRVLLFSPVSVISRWLHGQITPGG